jgi:tetratricopeptide (TPR) repeat protein
MIVTLPFVLLLVDAWPLRRPYSPKLLIEKVPFLALSAASAVIAYLAQRSGGAVQSLTRFPLGLRIENALIAWVVDIADMFWPARLAVLHPYPKQLPLWQAAAAALALACISALVFRFFPTRPYLAVGWFWYLGTLVPVIGLVQVGVQARADHFMYVPMVGLTIMLAWSCAEAVRRWPRRRLWITAPAVAASIALLPVTWLQIRYWKDGETLFRHAMAVTGRNDDACLSLATVLAALPGRVPDAISVLETGVRMNPGEDRLQASLGMLLVNTRVPANLPMALDPLQRAVHLNPGSAVAHGDLAVALEAINRPAEAILEAQAALRIAPDSVDANYTLGHLLAKMPDRSNEAIEHFRAALKGRPDFAEAHNSLGIELIKMPGATFEALFEFEEALRLKPDLRAAHINLGFVLAKIPGRVPEPIAHLRSALRMQPDPACQQLLDELEARQARGGQ